LNILDEKERGLELRKSFGDKDKLEVIYEIHEKLQEFGKVKVMDLNTREGQALFREMAGHCVEELMEAVGCLKTRRWTQTELPVDFDHFKEEMIDALGFMAQCWKLAGFTPDDLVQGFCEKYIVNMFRGETKY
jgi:hypothetical protein